MTLMWLLQEMGNVFMAEAREVLYTGYSGDPSKMNLTVAWQYMIQNGQASLFSGCVG